MQVVQINATFGKGSTGKICLGIAELLEENGIENCVLYSGEGIDHLLGLKYSDGKGRKLQAIKSRVFGNFGFNSVWETKALLAKLDELSPKIVHIHNIHSHNCHFKMLFEYLKEKQIKVIYTFHDCWSFTGYCTHFIVEKCVQWKNGCHACPQRKKYSWFVDRCFQMYQAKKMALLGLDLTVVTPSNWLTGLVKQSFLKDITVKVIHNGINLSIFKPIEKEKDSFEKIVLGVAYDWGYKKGLDVFISLAERLPSNYRIMLVGTDAKTDKILSSKITSIHRTHNQSELVEIYSTADVFVNPTREDSFPTVNIESLACGTPVITFRTGGSPECIDETCGVIVECGDIDSLEKEIIRVCETKPYSEDACVTRAMSFDQNERFVEYVELYRGLL